LEDEERKVSTNSIKNKTQRMRKMREDGIYLKNNRRRQIITEKGLRRTEDDSDNAVERRRRVGGRK
jgi:hypothetical protein